ncbi:subtilisin-like serine-protease S isoform X2 [Nymphaea colorata]|nr:subtilisin-like serine-protease S isoform X2 [Nymphaea colorata]
MEFLVFFFLLLLPSFSAADGQSGTKRHYIVYMGQHFHPNSEAVILANHAILSSVVGSVHGAREAVLHHYSRSFRGFSAVLTSEQARRLSEHGEVVSVFESKVYRVHTSHSWDFLGVSQGSFSTGVDYAAQQDVIVGVIDTGIWPESKSFSDAGMGPVPQRFKGQCVPGQDFTLANCNRKIIGARYYYKGFEKDIGHLESVGELFYLSARDADGHGTHTASTAAGAIVTDASFMGLANGTARGGAPAARLAIYKACWFGWCSGVDLLAAFDDAIGDGVDIISVSAAPDPPQPSVFRDAFSIGGFHAFLKGILVCVSAGNQGPLPGSATNVAPWLFTVAASSIDRRFEAELVLGDQVVLKGESLAPAGLNEFHDLIDARNAAAPGIPAANASFCLKNSLDPNVVTGKIVLCAIDTTGNHSSSRIMKSIVVQQNGGVGIVLFDPFFKDLAIPYVIPATVIGEGQYQQVLQYMATQGRPIATIRPPVSVLRVEPAPQIAAFSSRGPNTMNPDIIKPDITAPGLNILAAWSPVAVSGSGGRPADFNIISGTSMSCPHVSGAAALIKSQHPSWSPAAIKSALMTTGMQGIQTIRMMGALSGSQIRPGAAAAHLPPRPAQQQLKPQSPSSNQPSAPQKQQGPGLSRVSSFGPGNSQPPSMPHSPQSHTQPWMSTQGRSVPASVLSSASYRPQFRSSILQQRSTNPQQQQNPMAVAPQQQQQQNASSQQQQQQQQQQPQQQQQQQQQQQPQQNTSQMQHAAENYPQMHQPSQMHPVLQPQQGLRPQGSIQKSITPPSVPSAHHGSLAPTKASEAVETGNQILSKRSIHELLAQIDPLERLDPEVEDVMAEIADDFVESITTFSCSLAKHRKSTTLEAKDILLHMERNWNMTLPGFSADEIKIFKKPPVNDIHKQRMVAVQEGLQSLLITMLWTKQDVLEHSRSTFRHLVDPCSSFFKTL